MKLGIVSFFVKAAVAALKDKDCQPQMYSNLNVLAPPAFGGAASVEKQSPMAYVILR